MEDSEQSLLAQAEQLDAFQAQLVALRRGPLQAIPGIPSDAPA